MSRKQQLNSEMRQQKLEHDIAEFLKNGGTIEEIEPGRSGENPWVAGADHNPCTRVVLANRIAPGF